MKKFTIEITETLQRQIEIEAETCLDAERIAKQMYRNEEIVLNENDYIDTEIRTISKSRSKNYRER